VSSSRRRRLELVSVDGNPTVAERAAIERAVDRAIEVQHAAEVPSLWLRSGRAQGRRLGMLDYRGRFDNEDAWRLSSRFPFGGREYAGKYGRGDAK
jgi:hypothetical protein